MSYLITKSALCIYWEGMNKTRTRLPFVNAPPTEFSSLTNKHTEQAPVATCLLFFVVWCLYFSAIFLSFNRMVKKLKIFDWLHYSAKGGLNVRQTPFLQFWRGWGGGGLPRVFDLNGTTIKQIPRQPSQFIMERHFPSQPFVSNFDRPQLLF